MFNRATRIYAAAVNDSVKPLIALQSDETTIVKDDDDEKEDDKKLKTHCKAATLCSVLPLLTRQRAITVA